MGVQLRPRVPPLPTLVLCLAPDTSRSTSSATPLAAPVRRSASIFACATQLNRRERLKLDNAGMSDKELRAKWEQFQKDWEAKKSSN